MELPYENLSPSELLEKLPSDASLYIENIDLKQAGYCQISLATEDDFRRSIFLDHRIKLSHDKKWLVPTPAILNLRFLAGEEETTRYIFHISHVGSTLISRLLGEPDRILSLREPVLLRQLALYANELHMPESRVDPAVFEKAFDCGMKSLSRRFRLNNIPIVKCTSYANVLADRILRRENKPKCIMIYCKPDTFLPTILKGTSGWSDIIAQAQERLLRLHRMLGEKPWKLYALSPGELIAMSWVAEMLTLAWASEERSSQVLWLDFDQFLTNIDQEIIALGDHLNLDFSEEEKSMITHSKLITTYSKGDHEFDAATRAQELDSIRKKHPSEIRKGKDWLKRAAEQFPVIEKLLQNFGD